MSTAAQLRGEVTHLHHAYDLAVLLAEQGHSTVLTGGLDVGLQGGDSLSGEDVCVHQCLHCRDFLGSQCGEVGEVKAADLLAYVGAGLLYVIAQNGTQSCLQQMCRGVITHNGVAAIGIDVCRQGVAHADNAVVQITDVEEDAVGLLGVQHLRQGVFRADHALVTYLAAALTVEGGLVQNQSEFALGNLVHRALVYQNGQHF